MGWDTDCIGCRLYRLPIVWDAEREFMSRYSAKVMFVRKMLVGACYLPVRSAILELPSF